MYYISFLCPTVQCTCGGNPPGPNDCIATLDITDDFRILLAPPGVVCIQCTFDGVPATDATFQLDNANVDPEDGVTVNGVLVVCDSEQLFSTASNTDLSCTSGALPRQQSLFFLESESTAHVYMYYEQSMCIVVMAVVVNVSGTSQSPINSPVPIYNVPIHLPVCRDESKGRGGLLHMPALFPAVFRAPMITGVTTVNESDTLTLDCDASNSRPSPSVAWFNPEGGMVSGSRALMIENILRAATGSYSCVATVMEANMTSYENVTVQCECMCCAV